jgi:hypothetical protein
MKYIEIVNIKRESIGKIVPLENGRIEVNLNVSLPNIIKKINIIVNDALTSGIKYRSGSHSTNSINAFTESTEIIKYGQKYFIEALADSINNCFRGNEMRVYGIVKNDNK